LGVLGERGTGTGEHFGLQSDVDVVMATASNRLLQSAVSLQAAMK
jgi:7-keto-8-aminopelargonate synthetase-like enzyme